MCGRKLSEYKARTVTLLSIVTLVLSFGLGTLLADQMPSVSVLDGSIFAPSMTFVNDRTAGFYRSTTLGQTGVVGVAVGIAMPRIAAAVTPGAQAANSCAEQTFTAGSIANLLVTDQVSLISYPATGNATGYGAARVSAAGTISQTVCNPTAAALTPAAGTFVYLVYKPL